MLDVFVCQACTCVVGGPLAEISDMPEAKLLRTVERWLRKEKETTRQIAKSQSGPTENGKTPSKPKAPSFPSRHMAYFS